MGMIEYLCQRMKRELAEYSKSDKDVRVIATGGMAYMMADGISCIDHVDRLLTLEGLHFIYEKNKQIGPDRHLAPEEVPVMQDEDQ
jgi:type III pantothenate kinase